MLEAFAKAKMKYMDPPPWEHQLRAIHKARELRDLALFYDPGTGKTRTTIEILREKFAREKRVMRTLILGPLIVVHNWKQEFAKFSKISPHDVIPLVGPASKRVKLFTHHACDLTTQTCTKGKIVITNYEAMEMQELVYYLRLWAPEILVLDESHRLKNPESKRAKQVVSLSDLAKHRYLLTGTPILNSALDIYNQFRALDSGQTFSVLDPKTGGRRPMNFYEFRAIYFEDQNKGMPSQKHFPKWEARPETYEQLNAKIYRKALRAKKEDCLDLPPLLRQRIEIPLGDEQKRIYTEMKNEYLAWVKTHENSPEPRAVVAQMALTKALRLQQIVSGYCKTEEGEEVRLKENPRLAALKDLLEDLTPEHKVIVWATFQHNYRQIAEVCEKLKVPYVEIHGGVKAGDKARHIEAFRSDDRVRVVIGNQGAAGIGINLVEASYSIFYSRNFSLEQDLQAEARNYRGGSEIHPKITRIDLVAPGTIDELIVEALTKKMNIAEQILTWKDAL